MINAHELRVNNIVSIGQIEQMYITVKTIGNEGINHVTHEEHPDDGGGSYTDFEKFEDLQPIPLTPQILNAAGFEKFSSEREDRRNGMYFLSITPEIEVGFKNKRNGLQLFGFGSSLPIAIKEVKYLHQIQNLYYLFNSEELEIKLLETV